MCLFLFTDYCETAAPVKLRIVLGENDSQRLTLQDGIPETVGELVQHIKRQCGVENHFRLQFMDAEFGNEFTSINLTSMSEIQDKSTLKLVFDSAASALPDGSPPLPPPPYFTPATSGSGETSLSSGSLCDTDLLSSPSPLGGLLFFLFLDSHMIVSCSWTKPVLHSKKAELY